MGDIISFHSKRKIGFINETPVTVPTTSEEYLALCKKFIHRADYETMMCGILDEEYYETAEKHIQRLVDSYFSFED